MNRIRVSELTIFPVKSCRGIGLQRSRIDAFGLEHDRRWMVVDREGKFLTQRQLPRMCLIGVELRDAGIKMTAPDMEPLAVATPTSGERQPVTVWEDRCSVLDAGEEAAGWLSEFLDTPCRLVFFPADEIRSLDPQYAQPQDRTAFSDGFPLRLISRASLDDLNSRMEQPVAMVRFRPNLVVEGSEAYAEDQWQRLRIGDVTFRVVKPCSRCIIPNIDPDTAAIGKEPARTLSSYRKRGHNIFFGQNLIPDQAGVIEVGMKVELLD